MRKFIIKSTRWIQSRRRNGYFRDHYELVETDNILDYIKSNYIFMFDFSSQKKRSFCSAAEVKDYIKGTYRFIQKTGGDFITMENGRLHIATINARVYTTKYDHNLKSWTSYD